MIYFLKTSPSCNNNCIYCKHLDKKCNKHKSLREIEEELRKAKGCGFNIVKLSCNTEVRKNFLEILQLIQKYNFSTNLETNCRMFHYRGWFSKIDKYISNYEIYFSYPDAKIYCDLTGDKDGYNQFTGGANNILRFCKNKKSIMAKIVVMGHNLPFLTSIIDKMKRMGITQVKFILPFKLDVNDKVPSLVEAAPNIAMIKDYARVKILLDKELEYNPYITQDFNFFDISKAELKLDFKRHKSKPKFSIIIPTYNKKSSLKFVLNNSLKQDYSKSKYEIIIVDDGSNDKTFESIKKIKPSCNFKYFYWPRKKIKLSDNFKKWAKFYNRVGLARNIGINYAQGEIILFNDADALITRDCINKHGKYHSKYPNIDVRGFRMFLPEKFSPILKRVENFGFLDKISFPEKTERGKKLHCRMHDLSQEGWQRFIPTNLSIRKKYLSRVGGFRYDSPFWGHEDIDMGYRLSKLRMKLMWDDKIKVYPLYHPSQTEGALNTLSVMWINLNILYRKYLDEEIYNIYRDVIVRRLDNSILN